MVSEVHNCDCFEYMQGLSDGFFDLAVADPPYWEPEECTNPDLILGAKGNDAFFKELRRVSKAQIIWGANNYGFPFKGFVVWDKTNIPDKFTYSSCEIASVSDNLSVLAKIYRAPSNRPGVQRIHPTQKPVELYAWLFERYAPPLAKIFDPMMGSQSSRIAAYLLGFDYVGCELNKDFFDKGCERFDRECMGVVRQPDGTLTTQQTLF